MSARVRPVEVRHEPRSRPITSTKLGSSLLSSSYPGAPRTGRAPAAAPRGDLGLVLCALCAAGLVVASLLLLVGVRVAQVQTGYRVHDLQSELLHLKKERASLDVERATLLRPARLAKLSRTTLGLVPVDPSRVVAANGRDLRSPSEEAR